MIFLASRVALDPKVLRARYQAELRTYLVQEAKHDLTLELWLEACGLQDRSSQL